MSDPILTTREAAHLLGVSIRTVQTWIEQNVIESWKTPGGHRRVRRSRVIELRERMALRTPPVAVPVLVIAGAPLARRVEAALGTLPGLRVTSVDDPFSGLIEAGHRLPAAVVIELARGDWKRIALLRRLLATDALARARIVVVTEIGAEQLRIDLGEANRVKRLAPDVGPDALRMAAALASVGTGAVGATPPDHPVPHDEAARLHAVARSQLVDTPAHEAFDAVAALAARLFDTPIALITLITRDRQWFKARHGLSLPSETPRAWAFCNHTILQPEPLVVEDAAADPRFAANPLVTGAPGLRFYGGATLRDYEGYALGALCVLDLKPRRLAQPQRDMLRLLAELLSDRINLATRSRQLRWAGHH
ncbi:GAF domain-containing protein [Burkholderia plantarii]|uniref:GAF domain-containing protein n=1 Tax=Burkholderia plantarii TaxID=41899 RepID=UPI0018DD5FD4|nr:GAF domain-containing protein [Burkholderia plantarii]MBI0330099.1 excisionase family DNA-binding protein [Burkholderia plantarii]